MSPLRLIVLLILLKNVFTLYQFSSNVTLLTSTNFYHMVNDDHIWIVNFYSSKTDKNRYFAEEFISSADILKGIVKFGAIDINNNEELANNFTVNINSLPIVKFYGISHDGNPKEYGGPKNVKDLVDSVIRNILDKIQKQIGTKLLQHNNQELTDENFDRIVTNSKEPWMVLFYAPWCVHCKELKPIWSLLVTHLQKKVKCASIDATTNKITADRYEIKEFPTIKLLPYENKSLRNSFDYTQERTVDSIVDWALGKLAGPQVIQITSAEVFQRFCLEQKLCVITVLPTALECQAKCRRKYLDNLKQLGEEFKKQDWGWVWTEAVAQKDLEDVLGIGGFGYPALVVLNPVKMRYSLFKGAFTKNNIQDFLKELAKINAIGVVGELVGKIVTVEDWDGTDAATEMLWYDNKEEL